MFDVAIVGAGPAGAWTAWLLARQGARVALIDGSHPREKPCGGGLTGRALALVSAAVPVSSLDAVQIRRARFLSSPAVRRGCDAAAPAGRADFSAPSGVVVPLDHAVQDALVVASRRRFDALLLDAAVRAGAELIASRVTRVSRAATGFLLETARRTHAARLLVGADGANSLVRRCVAAPLRRDQLSAATGYYAHGLTTDEIAIELLADPPGYLWSFPRPDHLAVGICTQADAGVTTAALRQTAARWMEANGLGRGATLDAYSWPIPSLRAADLRDAVLAGPDWLLVGDAAGLVDPITREGIFFALQSASFAADALASGGPAGLTSYATAVRRAILPELACAARLKAGFFRPAFTGLVVEALQHSAGVRRVMADLVAGVQPYQGLKWRLLATLEAGLAWKLLRARGRDTPRAHAPRPAAD